MISHLKTAASAATRSHSVVLVGVKPRETLATCTHKG